MKIFSHNKGFTLVELMVAMAILSILVVAFTNFFGWNILNIFETGERSKAIAEAEKKLERLYVSMDDYSDDIEYVENYEDLFVYEQDQPRKFYVEEDAYINGTVQGCNVTVVVFYKNGERHASLSAFIEGGT